MLVKYHLFINNKENIEVLHHWPISGGNVPVDSPHKRPSILKLVSCYDTILLPAGEYGYLVYMTQRKVR